MEYRMEKDTFGEIQVPKDKYWGAQTQRSYENFRIGTEKIPPEAIRAFAVLKKAAARANLALGILDERRAGLIQSVCDEILSGQLADHFPLSVWQTGSGTQTNMNVNEVIANRGNQLAGERLLHPNDHVNRSQSSNDTFPTAMHIVAYTAIHTNLFPALAALSETFHRLCREYADVIKIGRTHLMDATPLTLGQEISGWAGMLDQCEEMLRTAAGYLTPLALGGTAVGTGLNAPAGFAELAAQYIAEETGFPFISEENKFHALTSKDALAFTHGGLKALASNLMKIANDIRLLSSGPRCGIGELSIPANEPGSSIMPGKVNPTQCEALTMVAAQVMANDVAVGIAASQGILELNVFMPMAIHNFLQSVRLLSDGMRSFNTHCAMGIRPNRAVIDAYVSRSLMLVTCLTPAIGYEKAAEVAKYAHLNGCSLKDAVQALGVMTPEAFDAAVRPENMV